MTQEELDFDAVRGGERVKEWFVHTVCASLGEEGFEQCYTHVMNEAYECPGDDEWYQMFPFYWADPALSGSY